MHKLDYLANEMRITLLSYRAKRHNCVHTLRELAQAEVLEFFDDLVFCKWRTTEESDGQGVSEYEVHTYGPPDDETDYKYYWFTNGKDAYIEEHKEGQILFADDKTENIDAVLSMFRDATCIEMPRKKRRQSRGMLHAHSLEDLYSVILTATRARPSSQSSTSQWSYVPRR